jgi:hypothetical protein
MTLCYPTAANLDNSSLVRVVYARGPTGFCLTRHAIAEMAQVGSAEAKGLLLETSHVSAFPLDLTNAYLYPVNPNHRTGMAKYFWENRSDAIVVQVILELGPAASPPESCLDVEYVRLLPGEKWMIQRENESTNHREYVELVRSDSTRLRYTDCSLVPVAYAAGVAGFSVGRNAIEIMATRGSVPAKQVLAETEMECRWRNESPDDKYHYPINALSHGGAAEYFWKNRSDPFLVQVISDLGAQAGHSQSKLRVQHIRLLPNETYKVEYACPVGYGYHDDEQITIKVDPQLNTTPTDGHQRNITSEIKATTTTEIKV